MLEFDWSLNEKLELLVVEDEVQPQLLVCRSLLLRDSAVGCEFRDEVDEAEESGDGGDSVPGTTKLVKFEVEMLLMLFKVVFLAVILAT